MQQLTLKACARLRRYGLLARRFSLSVRLQTRKTEPRAGWSRDITFAPANDNATILAALRPFWQAMQQDTGRANLSKVSVSLSDLYEPQETTPDLFAQPKTPVDTRLSQAIDQLNSRYGKRTLSLGVLPETSSGYVGTKIAFNRIPDLAEFQE